MICLNPLVIHHEPTKAPPQAPPDEFHCKWYELTDRISYIPGIKGRVTYKACFHDLPRGLQTHVYAPAGLEIKEKWSIGGNEPGEEREIMELGMHMHGIPREGLYLREDVDMRCNFALTRFVLKKLRKAHEVLVERLRVRCEILDDKIYRKRYASGSPSFSVDSPAPSTGSIGMKPQPIELDSQVPSVSRPPYPDNTRESWDHRSSATLTPSSRTTSQRSSDLDTEMVQKHPSDRRVSMPHALSPRSGAARAYVAELPSTVASTAVSHHHEWPLSATHPAHRQVYMSYDIQ